MALKEKHNTSNAVGRPPNRWVESWTSTSQEGYIPGEIGTIPNIRRRKA